MLTRGLLWQKSISKLGGSISEQWELNSGIKNLRPASINVAEWGEISYKVGLGMCVCVCMCVLWDIGEYEICICVCVFW